MRGQFVRHMDRQLITEENTILWLLKLKEDNDSKITAAQDQALKTKRDKNLQTGTDSKCRLCKKFDETLEQFISARAILTKEPYIKRHDRVYALIRQQTLV